MLVYTYCYSTFINSYIFQDFTVPKRPFRRMNYADGVKWLKENGVTKDDGTFYEFGEVNWYF